MDIFLFQCRAYIKHFIVQLMHTTLKKRRVIKTF